MVCNRRLQSQKLRRPPSPELLRRPLAELGDLFEMADAPDKGLAYVAFAAATCDDSDFLGFVAAFCLEDVLEQPSPDIINWAEAEALRSERFRWLIGTVQPDAMSKWAPERLVPLALPRGSPLPPNSLI